jgi:hypothetical protein
MRWITDPERYRLHLMRILPDSRRSVKARPAIKSQLDGIPSMSNRLVKVGTVSPAAGV